uniref:Uncharacterized protein n=1 Tax=Spongospora subterranea TaxID=70186 RepID=A0A0H5QZX3_9EUKA|eukprot:CRZ07252.1 hypothetical protein [Spongospora subterranea]
MNWFNVMIFPLCNSEAMEGLASRDSFDVFDFSWSLWRNTHIAIVYGSQTNYFDCTSAPLLNFGISGHQISERIRMAISNLFSWFSCSNIDPQFCRDGSSVCEFTRKRRSSPFWLSEHIFKSSKPKDVIHDGVRFMTKPNKGWFYNHVNVLSLKGDIINIVERVP